MLSSLPDHLLEQILHDLIETDPYRIYVLQLVSKEMQQRLYFMDWSIYSHLGLICKPFNSFRLLKNLSEDRLLFRHFRKLVVFLDIFYALDISRTKCPWLTLLVVQFNGHFGTRQKPWSKCIQDFNRINKTAKEYSSLDFKFIDCAGYSVGSKLAASRPEKITKSLNLMEQDLKGSTFVSVLFKQSDLALVSRVLQLIDLKSGLTSISLSSNNTTIQVDYKQLIKYNVDFAKGVFEYSSKEGDQMWLFQEQISLFECVKLNQPNKCKQILKSGCDPDFAFNGSTALMEACALGNLDIVKLLLNNGATINLNIQNRTALTCALDRFKYKVAEFLCGRGANVNSLLKNDYYEHVFFKASSIKWGLENGLWPFLSKYMQRMYVYFMEPVDKHKIECLLAFLEIIGNYDYADATGWSALFYAVQYNGWLVKELLKRGASPNVLSRNEQTPLMIACGAECSRSLIFYGPFSKQSSIQERSSTLTIQNRILTVKNLLKNKALVDIVDDRGNSALVYAAMNGYVAICKMLLKAGACKDLCAEFGKKPAEFASNSEIADLLK